MLHGLVVLGHSTRQDFHEALNADDAKVSSSRRRISFPLEGEQKQAEKESDSDSESSSSSDSSSSDSSGDSDSDDSSSEEDSDAGTPPSLVIITESNPNQLTFFILSIILLYYI